MGCVTQKSVKELPVGTREYQFLDKRNNETEKSQIIMDFETHSSLYTELHMKVQTILFSPWKEDFF